MRLPRSTALEFLPVDKSLIALRQAIPACRGCELYKCATQAVFGEGPQTAKIVFIGEQPGDEEDHKGRPFVGPAGRLLNNALKEAGIDRSVAYVTNAVKHFKFEERGKRRIHKKPAAAEIHACRPWLQAEIEAIGPELMVCLGATAAQTVFGPDYRVTRDRGIIADHPWGTKATSTIHPSAILRTIGEDERRIAFELFVKDLEAVAQQLGSLAATGDGSVAEPAN